MTNQEMIDGLDLIELLLAHLTQAVKNIKKAIEDEE